MTQANAVRTTTDDVNGSATERLLVPEIDLASVPVGFLGEPQFVHPFFAELKASDSTLGSDANFIQLHMQAERVFHMGAKWHLLLRDEVGATLVKNFADLPAYYRFFAGGDNSVRGFAYNELSPLEAVCTQNPAEAVPEECQRHLPGHRRLHQDGRQGRVHRHGGGDPRPAAQPRHRHLRRLRQRPQHFAPSSSTRWAWACAYACRS